ncbi:hypothetical protein ZIOFF_074788 [Zingiber officinale]|uniref:BED-type domain-containing protein n=1 Tax=Zingiber officinale TaxID=94328 RepID=A0A8J5ELC2_ZINOF|nr:hypothetical protein ZIOFF_074788 [Zingiber officinale]
MASTWRTLTDQYPEVLEEQRRSPIGIALEMTVNPISLGQLGQLTQLITTMLMRRYDNNWEEEVEASVAEGLILEPTMQSFQGIVTPSHSRGIVSQLAWVLTVRMLTPFHSCCFKTCTSTLGNSRSLRIQQIKNYLSDMEIRGSAIDMPEFPSKLEWLNTAPLQFRRNLTGRVVLLDFWTYCCINCMHVLPDLEFLEKKYADKPTERLTIPPTHRNQHRNSDDFNMRHATEGIAYATIRLCPFSIYLICGSLFFTSLAVSAPSASLKAVGHVCGSRAAVAEEASVGGSGEASSNSGAATPSVASTTSGTSDSKRLVVNAPGNRSDPGWKHGIAVDENPKKVQCKYCQKVINGGIYRLKHHLAGTQKDVGACKAVSDDVRKEMWKIVSSLQENLIKRAKEIEGRSSDSSPLGQYEDEEVEGAKRQRREIAKNPADLFKKRGIPIHKETIARGKKITTYIYSRTALISLLHHFTKEKDLIRLATTRFATSYLTLGCLNDNKGALIRMFTSKEWKSSQFAKTKDGKVIENVVMDKDFWKSIITCLRSAYPLIKVLRLVDSDEKFAMGFIYEEMDRAKEKIQAAFNGIKKSPNFKADFEVKRGIYDCLQRMVESMEEVKKIDAQLEDFKYRKKFFGSAVHTKRRNRLKAKTMNDVVFVMANSKLAKKKELRKVNDYSIDDLASDDDWIVDDSENLDLDASNEDLVPVEEEPSSGAPHDDLELPSYDDDEVEEGGDAMEDAGDEEHMEDDYEFMNL